MHFEWIGEDPKCLHGAYTWSETRKGLQTFDL